MSCFGLELDIAFECPGVTPSPRRGDDPPVRVERVRSLPAMPADASVELEARNADGTVGVQIARADACGVRFDAPQYGTFHVNGDASWIGCTPADDVDWRWQRFLIGQVLPFVAVQHGYEVFHASVVAIGDRTIAFTGPSTGGKSTIAAALVMGGAALVADDVMTLDRDAAGDLRVHPGAGVMSIRHDAATRLGPDSVHAIGRPLGDDGEATRVVVPVADGARPLTDVCFLAATEDAAAPIVAPVATVDPRALLGAGYNVLIKTPERLTRHLDVCARIAERCRIASLSISSATTPYDVAKAVRTWLGEC